MSDIKQNNIDLLSKYEPKGLLTWFAKLCNIPHGSGNEAEISKFIADVLKPVCKELIMYPDGTIYAYQEATPGYENRKVTCLQAHSDMVCAKRSNSNHDFLKDPLELIVEDGWIRANDTTLGADDCLGVATILEVFTNKSIVHGPLECLITVSEETNMHGAVYFPKGVLKAKYLLNLDNEDTDSFCIGSEGGIDMAITHKFQRRPNPTLSKHIKINIKDGVSGHSGNVIRSKIVNANKLMFEFAKMIKNKYPIALIEANGGILKNAIAGFCSASFAIRPEDEEVIKKMITESFEAIKIEYFDLEKNIKMFFEEGSSLDPIQQDISDKLIESYNAMVYGVYSLSEKYKVSDGSVNWGVVKTEENSITADVLLRSLFHNLKYRIQDRVLSAFHDTDYTYEKLDDYPEWSPCPNGNPLEDIFKKTYYKMFNKEPTSMVTEGGLETGVIIEKYPSIIAISIGFNITGAHSPDEKTSIDKIKIGFDIFKELLINID